jgi:hypothetical protein
MTHRRFDAEPPAWSGSAALPVAALRFAPLRQTTPSRKGTCTQDSGGISNCH